MTEHLLSWILFLPLAGLLPLLFIPGSRKDLIRIWANVVAIAGFLVSIPLALRFDANASGFQFVERAPWIPSLGVQYLIGADGISMLLVMLTTLIGAVATLSSWSASCRPA
jgi:NADH-quinone oxidoreductase subunit M